VTGLAVGPNAKYDGFWPVFVQSAMISALILFADQYILCVSGMLLSTNVLPSSCIEKEAGYLIPGQELPYK
jgi:hypothetical protein